jgi:hypothetical protein
VARVYRFELGGVVTRSCAWGRLAGLRRGADTAGSGGKTLQEPNSRVEIASPKARTVIVCNILFQSES